MSTQTNRNTQIGLLGSEQLNNLQIKHAKTIQERSTVDINDREVLQSHINLIKRIGENYMSREFRNYIIDEGNNKVMMFLLHYFNDSKTAETIFADKDYKVHKNLMLVGAPGTGKTLMMQVFADYLTLTRNPNHFVNTSITEMMNYYKVNGHIDRYTYNTKHNDKFEGAPFHACLNDLGLGTEKQKSYGTTLETVIDEFLFARYELYQQRFIKYHITSNLTMKEFKDRFENRLMDRFKTFNVIALQGESRRK